MPTITCVSFVFKKIRIQNKSLHFNKSDYTNVHSQMSDNPDSDSSVKYAASGRMISPGRFTEERYQEMVNGVFSNSCLAKTWFPILFGGVAVIVIGIVVVVCYPVGWGIALCSTFASLGLFVSIFGFALCWILMERNAYVHNRKVLCCACTKSS